MNSPLSLRTVVGLFCLIFPLLSHAWWQDGWKFRKQLSVDTSKAGGDIAGTLTDVPVLVRLHAGNFGYFLDLQQKGEDLRFVAGDDKTPLKYHIESFDPVNEMALIWVQMPKLAGAAVTPFWMYYGNDTAVAGEEEGGIYDADQVLVYHFNAAGTPPVDATAYGITPLAFTAQPLAAALIGAGASFTGSESLEIAQNPVLAVDPQTGWTFTTWLRINQPQTGAVLLDAHEVDKRLRLTVDGTSLSAAWSDGAGTELQTSPAAVLTPGEWQHVALVMKASGMTLYVNGAEAAAVEGTLAPFSPVISVGRSSSGEGWFVGDLDELGIARVARSPGWIKLAATEGRDAKLMVYGEDGQKEASGGGTSYFAITMRNVTVDGWVVILVLVMMAALSWVVMVSKGLTLMRVRRDNADFLRQFAALGTQDVGSLDVHGSEVEEELQESPLLLALSGRHEHFQSSSLYRIYHSGVRELEKRLPRAAGAQASGLSLTTQAIDTIRATMDATLVRETQRLNAQMVLLTIAISGGPFLGLLGTVVGVMITFASIAAAGDVNINAIAPGIAAALLATVAGLAVAIPALFGYNYLGSRIKDIIADMHVFVDEFVTRVAEQHS
jgi:biopolymer transport protein ExbB